MPDKHPIQRLPEIGFDIYYKNMKKLHISGVAKFFGASQHDWIGFDGTNLVVVKKNGIEKTFPVVEIEDFFKVSGTFWDTITFKLKNGRNETIKGTSSSEADGFVRAVDEVFARHYYESMISKFRSVLSQIPSVDYYWRRSHFDKLCAEAWNLYGSFSYKRVPPRDEQACAFEKMNALTKKDLKLHAAHNQEFAVNEILLFKNYFDSVEKKPLSDKQREAVVLSERSNLVIAGAGSGKTSVMVARVGYVIKKYGAQPHEILLLAFNKSAAEELQERISERLNLSGIKSSTFHALGLEIIAKATGVKPSLSKVAEDDKVLFKLLSSLIDEMGKSDPQFAVSMAQFLAFPLVQYRSADSFDSALEYNLYLRSKNIRTYKDEKVKSFEELEIANFLFIHQIEYEYEPYYIHPTANEQFRQYQPDFYLPKYGVYIEHFGIDENGNTAPYVDRELYHQGIDWKRKLHAQYSTKLIETYSYERRKGGLGNNLSKKLIEAGVVLKQKSVSELLSGLDDAKNGSNPVVKLFGTFLNNYKSNRHSIPNLVQRADDDRTVLFLKLFEPLYQRYEEYLRSRGEVDFNDMILMASEKIQDGTYQSPYRFILVDEFQDISVARAGLVKALLKQDDKNILTAVGDDWQSINRFAGSDISIFKEFGSYFGESDSVTLDYTYRYNDKIALASKFFIEKNPSQITKHIKTISTVENNRVNIWWTDDKDVDALLSEIVEKLAQANMGKSFSVFILARYRLLFPKNNLILELKQRYPQITFELNSVHASKGLEADYVIGVGVDSGKYGFPSAMESDPVIDIVLAKQEEFEYAEERRLFYVLLTRAKQEVHLIASLQNRSPFSLELEESHYPVNHIYPDGVKPKYCPQCLEGTLKIRKIGNKNYFVCSNSPICDHQEQIYSCKTCSNGNLFYNETQKQYVCSNCYNAQRACPHCGHLLVERLNKKTKLSFIGCSNFNKGCKYVDKKR